ncbi:MAG: hypothetical protein H6907_18225 [Hyphomicrobiales bacterium]|nr:hypothetical protein [Hyphomicrobiales bacterium]MCP5373671.1 hypothetical protein [Hyphomicrobiales bacterium]
MGAFFLVEGGGGAEAALAKILAEQEFTDPTVLAVGPRRLYLYPKRNAAAPSLHRVDDRNFCAATGTLLYRSKLGSAALAALFADVTGAGIDPDELFGCFCLLVCVDGELRVYVDGLGIYPVWHDAGHGVLSSSFPAVAAAQPRLTVDPQCVYEYLFQGATYGWRTVFDQVSVFDCRRGLAFGEAGVRPCDPLPAPRRAPVAGGFDDHVARNVDNIRRYYRAIVAAFGDRVDTALSGGYDSRLTLALLREGGSAPNIHVYGRDTDADVRVAKAIAAGEGFDLKHEDKGGRPRVAPDAFADVVRRNFLNFNGCPVDGLLDNGTDLATRLTRCAGGELMLNGGGGEIYRNFFYLPDGNYQVRDLLWSFYSRFDPRVCTAAFDEGAYHAALGDKVRDVLGLDGTRMTRAQVEFLYVAFRCRFWMGLNNGVNNRFGSSLTPFIDPATVPDANAVPLAFKNHGRLEAAMIAAVDRRLAGYPSDYGHDFLTPPPLKRRLKDLTTLLRPPRLRRHLYRLKTHTRAGWPYFLGDDYVGRVVDPAFPRMGRFMKVAAVADPAQYNRLCTLEYLFQTLGAET